MAFNRTFNEEEKARLKRLIDEGSLVLYETDALKEGLSDTVKAIAEEMDLKAATLNFPIRPSLVRSATRTTSSKRS